MKTEKTSSEFKTSATLIDGVDASGAPIDGAGTPDTRPEGAQAAEVITEGSQAAGRGVAALVSPANVLTSMRIGLSGILLLLEPLGMAFYCVYALAGLTNMLDGPIARKRGTESRVGAVLDSAADLVFAAVACVKLLPVYWAQIPAWLLISAAFVFYLKVKNAIACFAMHKKLITMHTLLNRAAEILLFAFPFACMVLPIPVYGGICAVAAFAATVDAFVRMVAKAF